MDFRTLLKALLGAEVEFIVVGGVSAVLQGVPTSTFDVDIVHSRDPENRRRLLAALRNLEARYREHLPRVLEPSESDLDSDGHMLLMTAAGPLDVLGSVAGRRQYADLLPHSVVLALDESTRVRILGLEMLIRIKEEVGREKDLASLPLLRRTLEERGRGGSSDEA